MKWILGLAAALCLSIGASAAADDKKTETYEGTLSTGVSAIGGEHTGFALKTKDKEYELALSKELMKVAEGLDGKKVVVTGVYKPRKGVEVKERRIIEVKTLKEGK